MMTMTSADLPSTGSGRSTRRKFSAQFKERIVAEYDALSEHGQRGAGWAGREQGSPGCE